MNPKYKEGDIVRLKKGAEKIYEILKVAQPGDTVYNRTGDNHPRYYVVEQGDTGLNKASWHYDFGQTYFREDEIDALVKDPCRCHPELPWIAENCLDCILKYYP